MNLFEALARIRAHPALVRWASAGAVFGSALLLRLYQIEYRSIWMDEDAQARRILAGDIDLRLIERAATQQQPPIDYYAEALGLELFGVTPLGARVHAALWGSLTVLVAYILLRRAYASWFPVVVGTSIVLLHPELLFYSQEARPIACGVFFASLHLLALHGFMEGTGSRWAHVSRALWVSLTSALFLLSVGFQPVIFLATSALALTPGLFSRKLRWRVLFAWACLALAALMALPIIRMMLRAGTLYVAKQSVVDRLARIFGQMADVAAATWLDKYALLLAHLWPLLLVAVPAGMVALAWELKRGRQTPATRATLFLVIFTLAFPWLFDSTFKALVEYKLKERYYLTLAPALLLLVSGFSHHAHQWLSALPWRQRGVRLAAIGALIAAFVATGVNGVQAARAAYTKNRNDWASLYGLFKHNATRGVAYLIHLDVPGRTTPGFYSERFYYKRGEPRPVALRHGKYLIADYQRNGRLLSRSSVYIVAMRGWHKIKRLRKRLERQLPGTSIHVFHGVSVIHVERGGRAGVRRVFEVLVEHLERKPSNFRAYETLASMQLADSDLQAAAEVIALLAEIDSPSVRKTARRLKRQLERSRKRTRRDARP